MKIRDELRVIMLSTFFVLVFALFTFSYNNSFTGNTILDVTFDDSINYSSSNNQSITYDMAIAALNQAKETILEMVSNNFSVAYVNDTLKEAEIVFEQARYAEVLRNSKSTDKAKSEARNALKLVNWQNVDYSDVLIYTERIKARLEQAYLIYDSLASAKIKIRDFDKREIDTSQVKDLYLQAQEAFYNDQYEESNNFIEQIGSNLESKRLQAATPYDLKEGAKNFFQKYWWQITTLLLFLIVIIYFSSVKIRYKTLKNKISRMKFELETLTELKKKVQVERFKENKISGLVYNIRMSKYDERISEIKETLPVLELRLKKIDRFKRN